ncbi:class I SAM-dependent methyltransferase [Myxococcota bacterium]|nr:class I SAM-dependent methyltransferase [Myxococcota bacterium]
MSLRYARVNDGETPTLPPGPPYEARGLSPWVGRSFTLPCGDPRLPTICAGGPAPTPALENLVGLTRAWAEHPEWLSFMDPDAPNHEAKTLERALYLHRWAPWLPTKGRALDLGAGVGRFTSLWLDRGEEVLAVEADARSLERLVWGAAGRPGRLDLRWTTAERLGDEGPFDLCFAVELLNYVEDPAACLARAAANLRPGGLLFGAVEAELGWLMAPDVAPGSLGAWGGDGPLLVPGDRFVRTFSETQVRELLSGWTPLLITPSHYVLSGPFEQAAGPLDLDKLIAWEDRLAAHPTLGALNRAWTFVARRP